MGNERETEWKKMKELRTRGERRWRKDRRSRKTRGRGERKR